MDVFCIQFRKETFRHSFRKPAANRRFRIHIAIESGDAGIAVRPPFFPDADDLLHRIGGHCVIAVNADIEFRPDCQIGNIISCIKAAVFLIDIVNGKEAFFFPLCHKVFCPVGRAVINDQPLEIPAGLRAQTPIQPGQRMRPVVSWRKDRQCFHDSIK